MRQSSAHLLASSEREARAKWSQRRPNAHRARALARRPSDSAHFSSKRCGRNPCWSSQNAPRRLACLSEISFDCWRHDRTSGRDLPGKIVRLHLHARQRKYFTPRALVFVFRAINRTKKLVLRFVSRLVFASPVNCILQVIPRDTNIGMLRPLDQQRNRHVRRARFLARRLCRGKRVLTFTSRCQSQWNGSRPGIRCKEAINKHRHPRDPIRTGKKKPELRTDPDFRPALDCSGNVYGAGTRIRTGDLPLTRRLLYQLSYAGMV